MYAGSVLKSMLDTAPADGDLPAEFASTDRILQRWAVSIGTGLPADSWDDRPISKPPPLDDDTAIVVDQIILHAPPKTARLIVAWYKTPASCQQIAYKMGMSRRGLIIGWRLSLNFLKCKFEMSGNVTLARLLKNRVYASSILDELTKCPDGQR